jgi:hypothetical protein
VPITDADGYVLAFFQLRGQAFADQQVRIEGLRKGIVDYESIWKRTLAQSAAERAQRLQEIVAKGRVQ